MKLDEKLEECAWVPRPRLAPLRRLGIATVNDLLTHFPRRHEDRSKFVPFPREQSETPVLICGEVTKTSLRRFGGWKKIFEATLQEAEANALSQPLVLRWFNMHYVQKMIATGQRLVVYGKPRLRGQRICLEHPEFEVIEDDEEESIHFQRITPIYPATEGLSQRVFRGLIFHALENLDEDEVETLIPRKHGMGSGREALQQIHFPDSMATLASAREHLAFAEFFALQMMIASRRAENSARAGEPHCGHGALLERFLRALPFDLTAAQERVLAEVRRDLTSKVPMNRLLQGDVGSGKTVVAIGAILLAVEAGYQAALMAPTQILAEQHYAVLGRWLEPLGVRLALRTGARSEDNAPLPLFAAGEIQSPGSAGCQPAVSGSLPETTPGIAEPSYRKRALPHFERPWAKYAITIATRNHRVLSEPARDVVMESILRWNDHRYALFAACVMPDHVHMLIEPMIEREDEEGDPVFFSLSKILHSIKSFTATRVNKIEKATGAVWETESFDRMIRSESDLQEKFRYVTGNPWTSGVAGAGDAYRWVWYHGIAWERGGLAHAEMFAASCREQQAGSLRYPERNDPPQILIGTHALLYEGVSFEKLGLVVIDEQHKFGVSQRARLTSREPAPDVLVMTATPIPRTLTMTVYGDLDVSTIDEMPANRGKIITAVRDESKLGDVLAFLRKELEAGRQAYIIYPLIEESGKLDVKAATVEFEKWRERLRPFHCDLLHGRVPAPEKQAVMERFRRGETSALISTTVIEVGVDVPNATVMLIENAERFGLAQLHQLRGRIGRGEHKSYCILMSEETSPETLAKLGVLEKTHNGFEVAEADWDARGPGDLLGTAQSGLPGLKLGNLKTDMDLMRRARAAATLIMENDPRLESVENQRFRVLVVEEQGRTFAQVS